MDRVEAGAGPVPSPPLRTGTEDDRSPETEGAAPDAPALPAGRRRATLVGATAVLMWSSLALLTTSTGALPPFLLVACAFGTAFLFTLAVWTIRGGGLARRFRWPARAWLLGVGGLFGYHAFYFAALREAPAAQANLVNYLWPLLIVLLSSLLPGERLRWWHALGALLGLAGAGILISDGGRVALDPDHAWGYAAALAAAVTWAGYSVLSRLLPAVPSEAVGAFCGATAVLAAAAHLLFEPAAWPQGLQWVWIAAMGAGPTGAAFFAWDVGMKRGDIRVLGGCAYLTPLLSTALLVLFHRTEATGILLVAAVLVTAGALLASRDLLRPARRGGSPAV